MIYWDKYLGLFSIVRDYGNLVVFFYMNKLVLWILNYMWCKKINVINVINL